MRICIVCTLACHAIRCNLHVRCVRSDQRSRASGLSGLRATWDVGAGARAVGDLCGVDCRVL
eukprot:5059688-Prymnesium_polylepis.1